MIILIHTSKTMRPALSDQELALSQPILISKATSLAQHIKTLSVEQIAKTMKVSEKLAASTKELVSGWTDDPHFLRPAIESFLGDIYSGLQVASLSQQDRLYANDHVRIISGLYGVLRPLDGIYPYRLEMGYRLPDPTYANLYRFWGTSIIDTFDPKQTIIDLTAVEYGKTVTKYVELSRIVTPRFLTMSQKIGKPVFVVVHAKIARGAFAHWMVHNRIEDRTLLRQFNEIGYVFDDGLSTPEVPVFICQDFQGLGLSIRLS